MSMRRRLLYTCFTLFHFVAIAAGVCAADRPNIVLCMTDDQGWGDVAYNGHPHVKTPVLDEMAATGLRFDRFYAGHPVCSPTRGSCMTGRNPNRFGCFLYNYSIRPQEVTIAEALQQAGYATGHFGKWHLGPVKAGSPTNPGNSGFDEWLSHDNFFEINPPLSRNGAEPQVHEGESSAVVVAAALDFIGRCQKKNKSFLAVVWFGSPHSPHKATAADKALYKDLEPRAQNFLGEVTAMDRAMGTLRKQLRAMKLADNTLLWFCSDNGAIKAGSTGGLKGGKSSLYEGGIRVPAIIEWPARITKPMTTDVPAVTSDIYPTIIDLLGIDVKGQVQPLDGISLVPLFDGKMKSRPQPIGFWKYPNREEGKNDPWLPAAVQKGDWRTFRNFKHPNPRTQDFPGHAALIDNQYKLHKEKSQLSLYDLAADPAETKNIAAKHPDLVKRMGAQLDKWQASVEKSLAGEDYQVSR